MRDTTLITDPSQIIFPIYGDQQAIQISRGPLKASLLAERLPSGIIQCRFRSNSELLQHGAMLPGHVVVGVSNSRQARGHVAMGGQFQPTRIDRGVGGCAIGEIEEHSSDHDLFIQAVPDDLFYGLLDTLGYTCQKFVLMDNLPITFDLLQLLSVYCDRQGKPPQRGIRKQHLRSTFLARRAEDYIQEFAITEPLDVLELCREINVTRRTLELAFRNVHDCGLYQFALSIRLNAALVALRTEPPSDVAIRYGFHSHSHFSRLFKKQFGVTPTEYRRKLS